MALDAMCWFLVKDFVKWYLYLVCFWWKLCVLDKGMNVESISWRRQVTQSFLLKRKTSASSSLISLQFLIPFPLISIWLLFNFLGLEYSSPTHDIFPTPIILCDIPIFHSFESFRIILSLQLLDISTVFSIGGITFKAYLQSCQDCFTVTVIW